MMRASSYLFQNVKLATQGIQKTPLHPKAKFKIKDAIEDLIVSEKVKPRHHPGILKKKNIELPKWTIEAMDQSLDDVERPQLFKESKQFSNYLFSRRLPVETSEIKKKRKQVEKMMLGNAVLNMNSEEVDEKRKLIKSKVDAKMRNELYEWKAIEYNKYRSLMYMVARSAAEYSVLYTIFDEIKSRDPDFVPKTMFDFGSGVGSALWAALQHWKKNIEEYVAVEISNDMNDLSDEIMKHSPIKVRGVFHRQYMPISNLKHDIVVSAYSLMELPNIKTRLQTIAKLWKKTNNYLILVEQGSNAGFQVMEEARSFIKHVHDNLDQKTEAFIFAPCPHEEPCPRYNEKIKRTPCNFVVQHGMLPLLGSAAQKHELFSYIVFKKGQRTEEDSWFRLVRPTIIRSKHARCRTCTSDGKLEEIVFTAKKHGKACYRCAKASRWGDRLPIERVVPLENAEQNVADVEVSETDESDAEESEYESENEEFEMKEDVEDEKLENVTEKKDEEEETIVGSKAPFVKATADKPQ